MDAKNDFIYAKPILLLAKTTTELFRCHEHLKTRFFPCFSYNERIIQMSQIFKTQFLNC